MLTSLIRHGSIGPLLTLLIACVGLILLHQGSDSRLVVDERGFGPASWPRIMLLGLFLSGIIWGVVRWYSAYGSSGDGEAASQQDTLKLTGGVMAVGLYGSAMVYIGFPFATFLFLIAWFVLGGMRRPVPVLACSTLGTLAMLYLFLKVAYLPLPRGIGYMDTLTVNVYRTLGIF